jgi:hypothetical protein
MTLLTEWPDTVVLRTADRVVQTEGYVLVDAMHLTPDTPEWRNCTGGRISQIFPEFDTLHAGR